MNFEGYPVYNFESAKVEKYVDNLVSSKVEYLSCVQKVIQCTDAIGYDIPGDFRIWFKGKVLKLTSEVFTAKRLVKNSSQQVSGDSRESFFAGAPLYGFDPKVLEINVTNLPTLE